MFLHLFARKAFTVKNLSCFSETKKVFNSVFEHFVSTWNRNRDRLHIPLCRTAAGQRAFTFRGQRLWNNLPDEFKSITNLDVFKVKSKKHFLRVFLKN